MKNILRYSFILWLLCSLSANSFGQSNLQLVCKTDTSFAAIKNIKVEGQFCKIDIGQSKDDQVHILGELYSDKNDPAYQILKTVAGEQLTVKVQIPSQGWTSHSGTIKVEIPNDFELSVLTTSGHVAVNSVSPKNATVQTKSGNIEAKSVSGQFSMETVTGKISVSNSEATIKTKSKTGDHYLTKIKGKTSTISSDGNVTIADVTGSIRSETTTGKTDIDRVEGEMFAKSATGPVSISDSNGSVTAMTFSGPIKAFNITGVINLQSTAGDQVGTRIDPTGASSFKTTEGKIKIQFDNIKNITFDLESTTSFIQALGKSKKKKLKVGDGPIMVTGSSTTGGQIYY